MNVLEIRTIVAETMLHAQIPRDRSTAPVSRDSLVFVYILAIAEKIVHTTFNCWPVNAFNQRYKESIRKRRSVLQQPKNKSDALHI